MIMLYQGLFQLAENVILAEVIRNTMKMGRNKLK
jgi:hypothetical protein